MTESEQSNRADLHKDPARVSGMFDQVASGYDRTNTVLSLGNDRYWRAAYPEIDLVSTKVGQLEQAGYVPVAAFVLPETCWTDHFYAPQAAAREQFLRRHAGSRAAAELVANERHETELYKKYKQFYGYAFYIGRKM